MRSLLRSPALTRLARMVSPAEALAVVVAVLLIELVGSNAQDDVEDMLWVLLLPMLFMTACSVARYRHLPLTSALLEAGARQVARLRSRLVLSLGLDFHTDRHPRLPAFTTLRRVVLAAALAALVLLPARGILRELLTLARVPGAYTLHVLVLGLVWTALLSGIAVQVPAVVLSVLEVLKGRTSLRGSARIVVLAVLLVGIVLLLSALDATSGVEGCLVVLVFAAMLPSVARAVDPAGAPWLNIAFGRSGTPRTAPLGELIRDGHRLFALESLLVVALLAPSGTDAYPVTDLLLEVYGWSAAWLFTGGALLALSEFNRRRRLFDPAFERSRVIWAAPGPEALSLADERAAIERSGWRLVTSDQVPGPEDADLLVGVPTGLMPPGQVPLARVPAGLFLLSPDPGHVLAQADERDKSRRAVQAIERLLTATRPRFGDRGEGTFLVPHCWMVVGLTRDDDRSEGERPPSMTFGQSFQSALGTRLRRYLHEVMSRAGLDVLYIEDAVTPAQVSDVLEALFDRHIRRVNPPHVGEQDFMGIQGVHVVLHDVTPETDGIAGVDSHLTRNAISRARILIVGRDRRDGGDDGGPPSADESSDSWLRDALRRLYPRLQPTR